jgi:hypothetical protein
MELTTARSSLSGAFALLLSCTVCFNAHAATNTVTSLNDSGAGSLRRATAVSVDGDVIDFTTNGTITLTSGELEITNNLTINGPGATNLVVSGNNTSRVFNISSSSATVTVSGVTIRDGRAPDGATAGGGDTGFDGGDYNGGDGAYGGGIFNLGTLTLTNCAVTHNAAGNGGGGYGGYRNGDGGGGGGVCTAPVRLH